MKEKHFWTHLQSSIDIHSSSCTVRTFLAAIVVQESFSSPVLITTGSHLDHLSVLLSYNLFRYPNCWDTKSCSPARYYLWAATLPNSLSVGDFKSQANCHHSSINPSSSSKQKFACKKKVIVQQKTTTMRVQTFLPCSKNCLPCCRHL